MEGKEVDMDAIEAHVRVAVPAYGRIYTECTALIETVKECYDRREQSLRCAQAEEDLARCTNEAICPADFARAMGCLGSEPEKRVTQCMPDIQALKACADRVGEQVYTAVTNEYNRLSKASG